MKTRQPMSQVQRPKSNLINAETQRRKDAKNLKPAELNKDPFNSKA